MEYNIFETTFNKFNKIVRKSLTESKRTEVLSTTMADLIIAEFRYQNQMYHGDGVVAIKKTVEHLQKDPRDDVDG